MGKDRTFEALEVLSNFVTNVTIEAERHQDRSQSQGGKDDDYNQDNHLHPVRPINSYHFQTNWETENLKNSTLPREGSKQLHHLHTLQRARQGQGKWSAEEK